MSLCRGSTRRNALRMAAASGLAVAMGGCAGETAKTNGAGGDPYATPAKQRSAFVWPEGKRVALSLTFDDARVSQAQVGIPLLDRYSVKATFYVSPASFQAHLPA